MLFSFQFSGLNSTSHKIGDSHLVCAGDGQTKNVASCDDGGALHPRDHRAGSAGHPGHIAVRDDTGLAAVKGGLGFGIKAGDSLLRRSVQVQTGAVYHCVTSVCHLLFSFQILIECL